MIIFYWWVGNSGCGVWILTVSKPLINGNRIADCGDSGVALVSNSDLHHDNQQLNSQFLQSEQEVSSSFSKGWKPLHFLASFKIEGVCEIRPWLLMQCQMLLVIHNWIQGNLEAESGILSEVTSGFSPSTPAIIAYWLIQLTTSAKMVSALGFVQNNCRGAWRKALSDFW